MLKLLFICIIIFVIGKEIYNNPKTSEQPENKLELTESTLIEPAPLNANKNVSFSPPVNKQDSVTDFDVPKPWSKVVYNPNNDYPYNYYIKLRIPSLNDYEAWKNIIPNLNFDPRSGELIIPSKDEASALALANLISINFTGQLSLDNILEKNLIQISISKAKTHEVVQHKLREQIIENLHGTKYNNSEISFEKDLVKQTNEPMIEAYTGGDYAYL